MKATQKRLKVQWGAQVEFNLRELASPLAPTLKALIVCDDVSRACNTNAILHQGTHRAHVTGNNSKNCCGMFVSRFLVIVNPPLVSNTFVATESQFARGSAKLVVARR